MYLLRVLRMDNAIPTSTQWTRDATNNEKQENVVDSVYMIRTTTGSTGSGFLLENGYIVTNRHVINGCPVGGITAISSLGNMMGFSDMTVGTKRDLAVLEPVEELEDGLSLTDSDDLKVGSRVETWGFPLGHSGPSPLLSVGYLAGFDQSQNGVKQLVVNGAFNNGNSGGALFSENRDEVIGVVVAKHAPLTPFQRDAMEVLRNQNSGFMYTATDQTGNETQLSQAQIVADILDGFKQLTQVMIGYAIDSHELEQFFVERGISYP